MERIIQTTADGSHTIAMPDLQVTYHSKHGAIQESKHVFIEAGLHHSNIMALSTIHVLEVGFGTGLNALLTAIEAEKIKKQISYTTIEAFPLNKTDYEKLNYGKILSQQDLFNNIHQSDWNTPVSITNNFQLHKIHQPLSTPINSINSINLIFFDAFAPTAQPELWTKEIFNLMYTLLMPKGLLVTYCSKGTVRRAMIAAGFTVEKIPGPPGKREMVRALKE